MDIKIYIFWNKTANAHFWKHTGKMKLKIITFHTEPRQVHFCDFFSAGNSRDHNSRYKVRIPKIQNVKLPNGTD